MIRGPETGNCGTLGCFAGAKCIGRAEYYLKESAISVLPDHAAEG